MASLALALALAAGCATGGGVTGHIDRDEDENEVVPHAGTGGDGGGSGDVGGGESQSSCDDGVLGGDEQDVDCGGSCPPCCEPAGYQASSGLASGSVTVCCGDGDVLIEVVDCGVGDNHGVQAEGSCGVGFEGAMNNGSSCVSITCEGVCSASTGSSGSGGGAACAHDACEAGEALQPGCDACVASVCAEDAYCCDAIRGVWDAACVGLVTEVCGESCP
jgi:hypothetical protein